MLKKLTIVTAICGIALFVLTGFTNFDGVQTDSGSASAPSFSFSSDTDTGVYRTGANSVGVGVGGSNMATIDSTGLDIAGLLRGNSFRLDIATVNVSATTANAFVTVNMNGTDVRLLLQVD